jgi:glycosyltransferase involved in cell wall biosynthesis
MTSGKVGIVIPAYNAARYVGQCLESALSQDYPSLHVYLVDDASTDNTCEVVSQTAKQFPGRITWLTRRQNKGEAFTRQEATEMALSDGCKYIAPLDADDLRKPNSLRRQIDALEAASDAGCCYGQTDFIHTDGKPYANPWWERLAALLKGVPRGEVWARLVTRGKIGTMDTVVIRDDVARACRYEPGFKYLEDLDYLAQIATLPRHSRFVPVDEVVATYRFHAAQSSNRIAPCTFFGLVYHTMRKIAFRVFWRLERQGRPVRPGRRRHLWRLLILRAMYNAARWGTWSDLRSLVLDFLMPIRCIEAEFRSEEAEQLQEILGVWATDGERL